MPRASHYDTDEERLPHGMTRVGYDADTQVYTFQDADGSYWESAPGCEYGRLTRVGDGPLEDSNDTDPFLSTESTPKPSWRNDMRPFLNFGVLIGLCLILLFWFLGRSAPSENESQPPAVACPGRSLTVHTGDTCWALAQSEGITVDEMVSHNPGLDCDKLRVGSKICLSA